MRIYMSGTISSGESANLLPTDLHFEGIEISGIECECSTHGNTWESRWKGVDIDGREVEKEEVLNLIKNKSFENLSGYVDGKAKVTITSIYLLDSKEDYNEGTYLDTSNYEVIEFEEV